MGSELINISLCEVNKTSDYCLQNVSSLFQKSWIIAQSTTALIMFCSIWTFASLIVSGIKFKKWDRKTKKKRKVANLLFLAVISPLCLILRVLGTQTLIIVEKFAPLNKVGDFRCEIVMDISLILFMVASLPVYTFLWYRQKMLYSNVSLKHLNTKPVRFMSFLFIFILVVGGLSTAIISTGPNNFRISNVGCIQKRNSSSANYINAAVLISCQILLACLFCFPLIKHKQNVSLSRSNSSATQKNKVDSVHKAVKLASISCAICIISDVCVMLLATIAFIEGPLTLTRSIYDVSLFINILCIIVCIENWKKILFSCLQKPQPDKNENLNSVNTITRV